jgi:rhodanese-related sulfurtransferase
MNNTETIKNTQIISTEELVTRLEQDEILEFWNVLTKQYYGFENIKGSRHVPLDRIGREVANKNILKDTEIIVYCAGPECPQSGMAAQKLLALGYINVKAYEGGLEEWEAAGLPIEQENQQKMACH